MLRQLGTILGAVLVGFVLGLLSLPAWSPVGLLSLPAWSPTVMLVLFVVTLVAAATGCFVTRLPVGPKGLLAAVSVGSALRFCSCCGS